MGLFNQFRKKGSQKTLPEEIFESICDLLNTKISFGAYQKDLGVNVYVYLSSNNEISKQIIQDIKNCLTKYENRIQITHIKSVPNKDSFSLNFVIQCEIQKNPYSFQLAFQHQQRQFTVEKKA
jgi:predicted component of type VI protein secretion system